VPLLLSPVPRLSPVGRSPSSLGLSIAMW
jgi:hypothetical protein